MGTHPRELVPRSTQKILFSSITEHPKKTKNNNNNDSNSNHELYLDYVLNISLSPCFQKAPFVDGEYSGL